MNQQFLEVEIKTKKLKDQIDSKSTEKALTALALETSRDKAAMQRKHDNLESSINRRFEKTEARAEQLQSKIYDCKVELETRLVNQQGVDMLTTRVDACATTVELADVKAALKAQQDITEQQRLEIDELRQILTRLQAGSSSSG